MKKQMKRYSVYWTVVTNKEDGIVEGTISCDVIASTFKNAIEWLMNNRSDFDINTVCSVYSYSDVNIAE